MDPIRIEEISLRDTYGVEEMTFAPGTVTIVKGENGSGKSSILNGVTYAFATNNDPAVIRNGAKASVIRMKLSNGVTFQKKTTNSRATFEIDGPSKMEAKEYVQALGKPMAINPAELLAIDASNKPGRDKLTKALLAVMPVEFRESDLDGAASDVKFKSDKVSTAALELLMSMLGSADTFKTLNLESLGNVRNKIYEARTIVGRDYEQAEKTVKSLSESLPPESDATESRTRLTEIENQLLDIHNEVTEAKLAQSKAYHERITEATTGRDRMLAEAKAEYQRAVNQANEAYMLLEKDIQADDAEAKAAIAKAEAEATGDLAVEKAALSEKIKAADQAAGSRQTLAEMAKRAKLKELEYDAHSGALAVIDAAKKAKLDALPIPGLSFEDGDVLYNGVSWHIVNLASRVSVVLQLMTRLSGKLSFLVLDDSEHLDPLTKRALLDGLREAGYQVIVAEVAQCPWCANQFAFADETTHTNGKQCLGPLTITAVP